MRIREEEFCSLATSPRFQMWLNGIKPDLFQRLRSHLIKSTSCTQNKDFMQNVVMRLVNSDPEFHDSLVRFLKSEYPHVLVYDNIKKSCMDINGVFDYYNPKLLTFPRRLILVSPVDLQSKVDEFVKDKPCFDYICLNDRVYIEYIPPNRQDLCSKIPENNWQIKKYKIKHNL